MKKLKIDLSNVPDTWDRVSCEQFLRLIEAKDIFEQTTALIDDDRINVDSLKEMNLKKIAPLMTHLGFLNQVAPEINNLPVPKNILVNDKAVRVPKQLDTELSLEAVYLIPETYKAAGDKPVAIYKAFVRVAAIGLVENILGEYKSDKVNEIEQAISKLPYQEIIPIGIFFCAYVSRWRNGGAKGLLRQLRKNTRVRPYKRVLKGLINLVS